MKARRDVWLASTTALVPCLLFALPLPALAQSQNRLPTGGVVTNGTATFKTDGSTLTITQGTTRSVINWNSFSIDKGNTVRFEQPNSNSAVLNRVTGTLPTTIAGVLQANGQVFLVNPNGIAITPNGLVDVGKGFVGTTLDIADRDFMGGALKFQGKGASGKVVNEGTIRTGEGGYVGLIGGTVRHSGTIEAPLGKVGIGSGEQATLDLNGDGFMQVALPTTAKTADGEALVSVSGKVKAAGGTVRIQAATAAQAIRDAVNISGVVSTRSARMQGGSIVLDGGEGGNVKVSGQLDASGARQGGKVAVSGRNVDVQGARIRTKALEPRKGKPVATEVATRPDKVTAGEVAIRATDRVIMDSRTRIDTRDAKGNRGQLSLSARHFVIGGSAADGSVSFLSRETFANTLRFANVTLNGKITVPAGALLAGDGALTLNDTSGQRTFIGGTLRLGGTLALFNAHGITIGSEARLEAKSVLVAAAVMGEDGRLAGGVPGASITNEGTIEVERGGIAAFLAPNLYNGGRIIAQRGRIQLAAASSALFGWPTGLSGLQTSDDVTRQRLVNRGHIEADGGEIALTSAAPVAGVDSLILNAGTLQARAEGAHTGRIVIAAQGSHGASRTGQSVVMVSGMVDASGIHAGERGGSITITGDNVALLAGAKIDASGADGLSGTTRNGKLSDTRTGAAGGDIRIGGDYLGGGDTPTARNVYVEKGATITADALRSGDAGRVIVWADNETRFYGTVTARAFGKTGDGGFLETSGKAHLIAQGNVDLSAAGGRRGSYFLDPTDITIYGANSPTWVSTDGSVNLATGPQWLIDQYNAATTNTALTGPGVIGAQTGLTGAEAQAALASIQAGATTDGYSSFTANYLERLSATSNIILQASNTIKLDLAGYTMTLDAGRSLSLIAGGNISTLSGGGITTQNGAISMTAGGSITLNHGLVVNSGGGAISLNGTSITGNASLNSAGGGITFTQSGNSTYSGVLSGGGGFTKAGTGNLTLSGVNTYTGTTSVNAGKLIAGNNSATGAATNALSIASGGTFDVNGMTLSIGGLSGAGTLTSGHCCVTGLLNVNLAGDNLWEGSIVSASTGQPQGSFQMLFTGSGKFIVTGNINAPGYWVDFGAGTTLQIGNGGTSGNWQGRIDGSGNLTFARTDDFTFGASLWGAWKSTLDTGTTVTLQTGRLNNASMFNVLNGRIRLAAGAGDLFDIGRLNLSATGTFDINGQLARIAYLTGSGTVLNDGAVANTLQLGTYGGTSTFAGTLTDGAKKLALEARGGGGANVILTGTNTHTGGTTLSGDNTYLHLGNGGTTGSVTGAILFTGSTSLRINRSDNLTFSNTLSGIGNFYKDGTNTLTLTSGAGLGAGSHLLLTGGTLKLGSALGNNTTGLQFQSGSAVLDLNGYSTNFGYFSGGGTITSSVAGMVTLGLSVNGGGYTNFNGSITDGAGTLRLVKNGTGTLALTNSHGFTGGVDIQAGTLAIATNNAISSVNSVNVATGATLYVGGINQTLAGLSGGGRVDGSHCCAASNLYLNSANTSTFSGRLGPVNLRLQGNHTLVLTGNDNDAGIYAEGGSTVRIGNGGTSGNWTQTIAGGTGSTLILDRSDSFSTFGQIQYGISLVKLGNGTATLDSTGHFWSGATTINAGTLNLTGYWVPGTTVSPGLITVATGATFTQAATSAIHAQNLTFAGGGSVNLLGVNLISGVSGSIGSLSLYSNRSLALGTLSATGALVLRANGTSSDLTLNAGAVVSSTATGDAVTLATGRYFINNAGAGAVTTPNGRWLAYLPSTSGHTFGGLDSGNRAVWAQSFALNGTVTPTGNRYIFASSPTITVTTTSFSKTYGADVTALLQSQYVINNSGLAPGVAGAYLPDTGTITITGAPTLTSTGATSGANASLTPYGISIAPGTLANDMGYQFVFVAAGSLTVNKAPLVISVDHKAMTYGGLIPGLTATYTGFVNGQTTSVLTTLPTLVSGTAATANAGVYTGTLTASGAASNNYDITYVAGNLTINKAALTFTVDNKAMTYGGLMPGLTGSYSGFVNGDSVASLTSLATITSGTASTANAGTYTGTLTASGAASNNYDITYVAGNLTINKAALTITADNKVMTYGGLMPTLTASYTGLVNGDTAASLTTLPTLVSGTAANSNAGVYAGTLTATGATSNNYDITYVAGNLTINKAALTITADNKVMTYGGLMPTLTASYTGLVNGDTAASLTTLPTLVSGTASTANAGVYTGTLTASGATSNNYDITYVAGNLTINKAALTFTVDNKAMTYGGLMPGLTGSYSGFVNGDSVASLTSLATITSGTAVTANAGVYTGTLTASGAASNNYDITYVAGNLTINKAALTITADNKVMTYGGLMPTLTASYTGLVNGDTAASLTTLPTLVSGTASTANAGVYTGTLTASGATSNNYDITYVAGNLTINKAALTITADNKVMTYGGLMPMLTASYTGLVNGDTAASLTTLPTLVSGTAATANAGTYTGTLTASGATSNNYDITYVAGNLTINKAALTFTVDNKAMTYGGLMPGLTGSYSGFVNGDSVASLASLATITSGTASTANAGTYTGTLTASGAASNNYDITYVAGNLTINKAALTFTVDNKAMTYGGLMPTLTGSYSGFVNGDSVASLTSLATITSGTASTANAGTYTGTLTASGATSNNYDITYVAGNLTINKAALTFTVDNKAMTYGGLMPTLTGSYSGFVNGDSVASLTSLATITSGTAATSNAGVYAGTLTATGAASNNYDITYVAGNLTINKAALTITALDQSKIQGQVLRLGRADFTVAGLLRSDRVDGAVFDVPAAQANAMPGTYAILLSGANGFGLSNYDITYLGGQLTVRPQINDRPPTIPTPAVFSNVTVDTGLPQASSISFSLSTAEPASVPAPAPAIVSPVATATPSTPPAGPVAPSVRSTPAGTAELVTGAVSTPSSPPQTSEAPTAIASLQPNAVETPVPSAPSPTSSPSTPITMSDAVPPSTTTQDMANALATGDISALAGQGSSPATQQIINAALAAGATPGEAAARIAAAEQQASAASTRTSPPTPAEQLSDGAARGVAPSSAAAAEALASGQSPAQAAAFAAAREAAAQAQSGAAGVPQTSESQNATALSQGMGAEALSNVDSVATGVASAMLASGKSPEASLKAAQLASETRSQMLSAAETPVTDSQKAAAPLATGGGGDVPAEMAAALASGLTPEQAAARAEVAAASRAEAERLSQAPVGDPVGASLTSGTIPENMRVVMRDGVVVAVQDQSAAQVQVASVTGSVEAQALASGQIPPEFRVSAVTQDNAPRINASLALRDPRYVTLVEAQLRQAAVAVRPDSIGTLMQRLADRQVDGAYLQAIAGTIPPARFTRMLERELHSGEFGGRAIRQALSRAGGTPENNQPTIARREGTVP